VTSRATLVHQLAGAKHLLARDCAAEARDTIERFHEALNRRDLDALGDLITDDCVFEATSPAPDGTRHVGRHAVLRVAEMPFNLVFEARS
jgi:ketosteroid isomerase-like protein